MYIYNYMSISLQKIANNQINKTRKTGGRPKKALSDPYDPVYKDFLAIFGLDSWDDNKTWTQEDLINNNAILNYFSVRPKLLKLSYPLNDVRKIKVSQPTEFQIK